MIHGPYNKIGASQCHVTPHGMRTSIHPLVFSRPSGKTLGNMRAPIHWGVCASPSADGHCDHAVSAGGHCDHFKLACTGVALRPNQRIIDTGLGSTTGRLHHHQASRWPVLLYTWRTLPSLGAIYTWYWRTSCHCDIGGRQEQFPDGMPSPDSPGCAAAKYG